MDAIAGAVPQEGAEKPEPADRLTRGGKAIACAGMRTAFASLLAQAGEKVPEAVASVGEGAGRTRKQAKSLGKATALAALMAGAAGTPQQAHAVWDVVIGTIVGGVAGYMIGSSGDNQAQAATGGSQRMVINAESRPFAIEGETVYHDGFNQRVTEFCNYTTKQCREQRWSNSGKGRMERMDMEKAFLSAGVTLKEWGR